ncbi:MAG: hypothetical protein U9Q15_05080 [Patescibacteria group bacterium]|nr:hypothetical protein [Patescibacteria group bacterium]
MAETTHNGLVIDGKSNDLTEAFSSLVAIPVQHSLESYTGDNSIDDMSQLCQNAEDMNRTSSLLSKEKKTS